MKFGGLLTEQNQIVSYASCDHCNTVYQDDCRYAGSLKCPCGNTVVVRGLTREQAKELVDDEYKELLA